MSVGPWGYCWSDREASGVFPWAYIHGLALLTRTPLLTTVPSAIRRSADVTVHCKSCLILYGWFVDGAIAGRIPFTHLLTISDRRSVSPKQHPTMKTIALIIFAAFLALVQGRSFTDNSKDQCFAALGASCNDDDDCCPTNSVCTAKSYSKQVRRRAL